MEDEGETEKEGVGGQGIEIADGKRRLDITKI